MVCSMVWISWCRELEYMACRGHPTGRRTQAHAHTNAHTRTHTAAVSAGRLLSPPCRHQRLPYIGRLHLLLLVALDHVERDGDVGRVVAGAVDGRRCRARAVWDASPVQGRLSGRLTWRTGWCERARAGTHITRSRRVSVEGGKGTTRQGDARQPCGNT